MEIDWIQLSVLSLFLAAMIAEGFWASRKQKTLADFYVGGRNFGTLTVTATQLASAFGGGMMIAHVGLGYAFGMAEMLYMCFLALGVLLLAVLVAGWLRNQNFYTTADWMVSQYGESKALRGITSVVVMLVTMAWWISQPIAAGKILHALTGLPVELGIVIAAAVSIVYTATGGIIAVAYTDVAQLGLVLLGMTVLLPIALTEAGGLEAVFAAVPSENLTVWAPGEARVWGWVLAILPGQMVLQVYHQRIYAAKSIRVAKRGLYCLAGSVILAGAWATLLGMAVYTLNPHLPDRDMAITWSITHLLPAGVAVFALGAIIAAIVSTADSALHSTAASITRDLYQGIFKQEAGDKEVLRFAKKCILAVGLVGMVIGICMPHIIEVLVLGYTLTAAGLFFPLFLGRFWNGASSGGAIAGMISGVATALLFSLIPPLTEYVPAIAAGMLASLTAMVVVSLRERAV